MRNEFNLRRHNPVKIRRSKYLNNIVEQDHRRVKFRVAAMLGFKSFHHARRVLVGIELIQKLKKGQYGVPFRYGQASRDIWRNVFAAWVQQSPNGGLSRVERRQGRVSRTENTGGAVAPE